MKNEYLEPSILPYHETLKSVRRILEIEIDEFPEGYCQQAARVVKLATGLEEVAGGFFMGKTRAFHAWNYDKERNLFIDVSQDMFDSRIPKIAVLSAKTNILTEERNHTMNARDVQFPHIHELFENYNLPLLAQC